MYFLTIKKKLKYSKVWIKQTYFIKKKQEYTTYGT